MRSRIPEALLRILFSLVAIAATTTLLRLAQPWLSTPTVALLYLLPVGVGTALWGLPSGIAAAVAAFLAFNFFYLPPFFTLRVLRPQDALELLVFLVVAITISQLLGAVQGAMASIVEWQSLKMQEYRYSLLVGIARFAELFGVRRPVRYEAPAAAGAYDEAVHSDHPEATSILAAYLEPAIPTSTLPLRPD